MERTLARSLGHRCDAGAARREETLETRRLPLYVRSASPAQWRVESRLYFTTSLRCNSRGYGLRPGCRQDSAKLPASGRPLSLSRLYRPVKSAYPRARFRSGEDFSRQIGERDGLSASAEYNSSMPRDSSFTAPATIDPFATIPFFIPATRTKGQSG